MSRANPRDDFPQAVLDVLAKRVGVRCSSPSCRKLTTGPRSDGSRIVCIGVGAHITAAAEGGPRYDPLLTREQRRAAENGVWLCQNCAKLVDNDRARYTVAVLSEWKRKAEAEALVEIEGVAKAGSAPEDAAELELLPDTEYLVRHPGKVKHGHDSAGTCDRHDYTLTVTIRNLGNERVTGYHVDLEMPARVLDQPEKHPAYLAGRSNRLRAFFRDAGGEAIFPGDERQAITLPYYVDDELFWNHRGTPDQHVFRELVKVTLYRSGLPPITVTRLLDDMQNF